MSVPKRPKGTSSSFVKVYMALRKLHPNWTDSQLRVGVAILLRKCSKTERELKPCTDDELKEFLFGK